MTRTFVLDVFERAIRTFLQGFLAVLATQWAGSGLGVDLFDLSAWQKILTAAAAAGIAAVVSLGTSLVSGLKTGAATTLPVVAQTSATPPGRHDYVDTLDGAVLDGSGAV